MTESDKPHILTGEQIADAERNLGFSHPVIDVIHATHREIEEAEREYSRVIDHEEQEEFVKEHYGFLADAIAQAGPFPLGPLDIVSLWAAVIDTFPSDIQRVEVAGMIASAYAIQEVENAAWEQFPTSFLKDRELPDEVKKNTDELEQIQMRLEGLQANLNVLRPFEIMDLVSSQSTQFLDEIQDNFESPMISLRSIIYAALRNPHK